MARRSVVRVTGVGEARRMVGEVGDRARRPEPVLRSDAVLAELHASEERRFARRWKPATREWVARKAREGLDPRGMRATGALHRALTHAQGPPLVRRSAWNGVLTWGIGYRSPVWYAAVQAKRGRNPVVIDTPARAEIIQLVTRYIARGELR